MDTLLRKYMRKYLFEMGGDGVHGKGIGIAHLIVTRDGFILAMFHDSIMMWTQAAEDSSETMIGTNIRETMKLFLGQPRGRGPRGSRNTMGAR